ncbi:putative quinol monooxygenase [Geminicoccus harenae]|uniref:putative quinol monooxygenase n=1 Tax=Geminicoccus harenae TaxID=2498453 RepID=UPI00168BFD2F|nr:putative quinol monooxygenase [Geminicoccus harenae]
MSDGLVVMVEFRLKPAAVDEFRALVTANARASVTDEPGCRRFDVVTSPEDPTELLLYEIYDDQAAFDRHLETPHFLTFKERSADLVESSTVRLLELNEHCKPSQGAPR